MDILFIFLLVSPLFVAKALKREIFMKTYFNLLCWSIGMVVVCALLAFLIVLIFKDAGFPYVFMSVVYLWKASPYLISGILLFSIGKDIFSKKERRESIEKE